MVNSLQYNPTFNNPEKEQPFENTVEKGQNADNHNFFYPFQSVFQFLMHNYFLVCKCFQFGAV